MAITSYPFDAQDTTEAQYSKLFRQLQDTGVADSSSGTGFVVSGDGSGLNVKVQAGFAIVRGHAVENDAVATLTIAAPGASIKYHMVVLRLDPTANSITLVTIGGGTTVPVPTQTDTGVYEMPLALVTVPASAVTITSGAVTSMRQLTGKGVITAGETTKPASPRVGQIVFNTTYLWHEYWTGSAWQRIYIPPSKKELNLSRTNAVAIGNGIDYDVLFDGIGTTNGFTFDVVTGISTFQSSGTYLVSAAGRWTGLSAGQSAALTIMHNGLAEIHCAEVHDGSVLRPSPSGLIIAGAGDTLALRARPAAGGATLNTTSGGIFLRAIEVD